MWVGSTAFLFGEGVYNVEFIVCFADGTWSTQTVLVTWAQLLSPMGSYNGNGQAVDWFRKTVREDVVFVGVYSWTTLD